MADNKGWTPLHLAVSKNYKSTLELLSSSALYSPPCSHIYFILTFTRRDAKKLEALSSTSMISPLHLAAKSGNLEAIQILLEILPVDITDKNGYGIKRA